MTTQHLIRHARDQIRAAAVLLTFLCFVHPGNAAAEELGRTTLSELAEVTVRVSSSAVQVAEPLTFEVTVTAPAGATVVLPTVTDQLGRFDVIDHHDVMDVPEAVGAGRRTWTRRLTLESILTGDLEVPSLELQVAVDDRRQLLKTEPLPVRVLSVLEGRADPSQFRDIQSVVDVDIPQSASRAWVWWTLGGVGAIAVFLAALTAIARRKTWITPNVWAVRELKQLRNSTAVESVDSDVVCQELTTIIRDYLQLQFDISASVQTTEELLCVVGTGKLLEPATASGFEELFLVTDHVRFAGLRLAHPQLTNIIEKALRLIQQTATELNSQPRSIENAEIR